MRTPRSMLLLVLAVAACPGPTVHTVPPGQPGADATPPALVVTSAGLAPDLEISPASLATTRRVPINASLWLRAQATDPDSGVRAVSFTGELLVRCLSPDTTRLVTFRDPIHEARALPPDAAALPVAESAWVSLDVDAKRRRCGDAPFVDLSLVVVASTTNGSGATVTTRSLTIEHFGPDQLEVANFNLDHKANHPDEVFQAWGRALGARVDIVVLTEAFDRRRTEFLAAAAGMPYVVMWQDDDYADVAIVSRTPLRDVQRRFIDRPGRYAGNDTKILSAITDVRRIPHQIIASHWAIRHDDAVLLPDLESPGRQAAADAMVSMIDPGARIVILGGDFNAHSQTGEVKTIAAVASDSFTAAGFAEGQGPCPSNDNRVDYLFFRGPVRVTSYRGDCVNNGPSDHGIVTVDVGP